MNHSKASGSDGSLGADAVVSLVLCEGGVGC